MLKSKMTLDDDWAETSSHTSEHRNAPSVEILESAAVNARYGSQLKSDPDASHVNSVMLSNNKKVKGECITLNDASTTIAWHGNPRNFEPHDCDDEELFESIQNSNGNTIPAIGRLCRETNVIEIIAGTRRRRLCIKAGVPFTLLLISCTDEEAYRITLNENHGREKPSFIASCLFHLNQFHNLSESYKKNGQKLTQQMYAVMHNTQLSTMQDYFSFARFPSWLLNSINNTASISYRACNEFRKFLTQHEEDLKEIVGSRKFDKCTTLLTEIKLKLAPKTKAKRGSYRNTYKQISIGGTENSVEFIETNHGTEIHINRNVSESIIKEIEALLNTRSSHGQTA